MFNKANQIKRRAFTMIELIMVIVVLGIVAMISTDIIAHMYKGYIQTKIINDLEQKTETLVSQIAARLQFRIKDSMIARNTVTNNFLAMNSDDINSSSFNMVEWIGYDYESFVGEGNGSVSLPGWSGFIDVDNPNTTNAQIVTPGSDNNITQRTIMALSNNTVSLDGTKDRPALIFKCPKNSLNLAAYGWDHTKTNLSDHNYTLAVTAGSSKDILNFDTVNQPDANRSICEQYYLAWSAYAIVPVGSQKDDFNLTLRSNYQPWLGERYDQNATSNLLAEHVSTFRVMQVGDTIRVKICIQDGNITGEPVGFCKEKAIF